MSTSSTSSDERLQGCKKWRVKRDEEREVVVASCNGQKLFRFICDTDGTNFD